MPAFLHRRHYSDFKCGLNPSKIRQTVKRRHMKQPEMSFTPEVDVILW